MPDLKQLLEDARTAQDEAYDRLFAFLDPGTGWTEDKGGMDAAFALAQGILESYRGYTRLLIAAEAMVLVEERCGPCEVPSLPTVKQLDQAAEIEDLKEQLREIRTEFKLSDEGPIREELRVRQGEFRRIWALFPGVTASDVFGKVDELRLAYSSASSDYETLRDGLYRIREIVGYQNSPVGDLDGFIAAIKQLDECRDRLVHNYTELANAIDYDPFDEEDSIHASALVAAKRLITLRDILAKACGVLGTNIGTILKDPESLTRAIEDLIRRAEEPVEIPVETISSAKPIENLDPGDEQPAKAEVYTQPAVVEELRPMPCEGPPKTEWLEKQVPKDLRIPGPWQPSADQVESFIRRHAAGEKYHSILREVGLNGAKAALMEAMYKGVIKTFAGLVRSEAKEELIRIVRGRLGNV